MRSPHIYTVAAMLVLVLVPGLPLGCDAKKCVFGCLRDVISCKRKTGSDECCLKYYSCYVDCNPEAVELPPCERGVSKRMGQWGRWERPPGGRRAGWDNYINDIMYDQMQ